MGLHLHREQVGPGAALYVANCLFCHGVPAVNNGGNIPNLGFSSAEVLANAGAWVLGGAGLEHGMPRLGAHLDEDDVGKIVAFIQGTVDAVRPAE